jgi:hypothetical protein
LTLLCSSLHFRTRSGYAISATGTGGFKFQPTTSSLAPRMQDNHTVNLPAPLSLATISLWLSCCPPSLLTRTAA